jgi:hypothetical protein
MIEELLRSTPSEIDEYSEDSEEDEDSEKSDDPKWKLYWTIRNYEVINGIPLCQNFMELPSKRRLVISTVNIGGMRVPYNQSLRF